MTHKRSIAVLVTLMIALAIPALAAETTAADAKQPKLTLVEPVKDFGTVPKGMMLDWTFAVKNTGEADLQILNAAPACGCTVADYDKVIKPGQTGKVTAHVDTTNFTGPIAKPVTLQTNDPNTPTAQITIQAMVKPYVQALPTGFVRFNVLQTEEATQSLTVFSEDEAPFQILGVETPGDWLKVKYSKIEKEEERAPGGRSDQNQYKFDFTILGSKAPAGPLAEKVVVRSNSKFQPEYQISITGVVRPTYMVAPSIVNFGEVAAGTEAERTVTVQANDKTLSTFKVNKVESSVKGLVASLAPTEQPGVFEVNVKMDKTAKAGDFNGMLKIFTTDSVKPVYEIPLRGSVK